MAKKTTTPETPTPETQTNEPTNKIVWHIELKKNVGKYKIGDRVHATPNQLEKAGLEHLTDYRPLGTAPSKTELTFNP
jgi:hypothetical protein